MKEEIPLIYKLILKKMWGESDFGKLKFHSARIVVNRLRLGKEHSMPIIKELKRLGCIECIGPHTIVIKMELRDLV